jgi:hypothetical protein
MLVACRLAGLSALEADYAASGPSSQWRKADREGGLARVPVNELGMRLANPALSVADHSEWASDAARGIASQPSAAAAEKAGDRAAKAGRLASHARA